jgi:hypothetical protein
VKRFFALLEFALLDSLIHNKEWNTLVAFLGSALADASSPDVHPISVLLLMSKHRNDYMEKVLKRMPHDVYVELENCIYTVKQQDGEEYAMTAFGSWHGHLR